MDKEILKLAFEAGVNYSGCIEFGFYAETFEVWHENLVKKTNDIQPVRVTLVCERCNRDSSKVEVETVHICESCVDW